MTAWFSTNDPFKISTHQQFEKLFFAQSYDLMDFFSLEKKNTKYLCSTNFLCQIALNCSTHFVIIDLLMWDMYGEGGRQRQHGHVTRLIFKHRYYALKSIWTEKSLNLISRNVCLQCHCGIQSLYTQTLNLALSVWFFSHADQAVASCQFVQFMKSAMAFYSSEWILWIHRWMTMEIKIREQESVKRTPWRELQEEKSEKRTSRKELREENSKNHLKNGAQLQLQEKKKRLRLSPMAMSLRLSPLSSSHPLESGDVKLLRSIFRSSLFKPLIGSFFKTIWSFVSDDTSSRELLLSEHSVALSDLHWLSIDGFLCGFDKIFSMEKLFLIIIVFSEFIVTAQSYSIQSRRKNHNSKKKECSINREYHRKKSGAHGLLCYQCKTQ